MDASTTSLPLSIVKSPAGLGISGSGSFQSHLSRGKSHQRLRAGTHSSGNEGPLPCHLPINSSNNTNTQSPPSSRVTTGISNWLPADVGLDIHASQLLLPWPQSWCQWVFLAYCCLSVIFLTTAMFEQREGFNPVDSLDISSMSPLTALSNQQRLSIISAIHPKPRDFEPFVLRGNVPSHGITACLWSPESDLNAFSVWAPLWTGPISLLVTTTAIHSSAAHQKLLEKISNLKAHLPVEVAQLLSLHILYISSKSSEFPNAYLNLARLFSRTDHSMLFPGNFSILPPPTLFGTLLSQLQHRPARLAIISNKNDSMFPFPIFAPALVSNDHSMWCTERFFLSSSRGFDWDACLWQLWLDSFGDVTLLRDPHWKDGEPLVWRMNSASKKLRQRLSFKHRTETCVLAGKRLNALSADTKGEKETSQANWLKNACERADSYK